MYDYLKFIDSAQVREYNKDTRFTPAEWSLIVAGSMTTTVEEKLEALQYLLENYTEQDFAEESVNVGPGHSVYQSYLPCKENVRETVWIWEETLADRYDSTGSVFAAGYGEKEKSWLRETGKYRFFPNYEKAYMYLREIREERRKRENFRKEEMFGEIYRLKAGEEEDWDGYIFDGDLRMVEVLPDGDRCHRADGSYISLLDEPEEYNVFVPLPFKKGDIIKVEDNRTLPYYGVMCCDWKCSGRDRKEPAWLPLEFYYEQRRDFDYSDGGYSDVLRGSLCPEEELPGEQQMLKRISAIYKGEADFFQLLSQFSKREI